MSSEWKEQNEQLTSRVEKGEYRPDKTTQQAIRDDSLLADRTFADRQGREMALRTYPAGNNTYYIRAYDLAVQKPPETVNPGQAGYANLRLESGRAKLQDIQTPTAYEGNGIGGQLLSQAENVARQHGSQEIYGLAPSDPKTLDWYRHRNYQFRINDSGGSEVYRVLR